MNVPVSKVATAIHRWTRQEFEHMVELGAFEDKRVELIDGYILDMAPQSSLHALAIRKTEETLRRIFPSGHEVRSQMPLAIDDSSEPEPDVAVVIGHMEDYRNAHPTTALLVVEVAYSSLDQDGGLKKSLYARNGIQEYWIVNLDGNCLEVCRQPQGETYQSQLILSHGDSIQPLANPGHTIPVADLLP